VIFSDIFRTDFRTNQGKEIFITKIKLKISTKRLDVLSISLVSKVFSKISMSERHVHGKWLMKWTRRQLLE